MKDGIQLGDLSGGIAVAGTASGSHPSDVTIAVVIHTFVCPRLL